MFAGLRPGITLRAKMLETTPWLTWSMLQITKDKGRMLESDQVGYIRKIGGRQCIKAPESNASVGVDGMISHAVGLCAFASLDRFCVDGSAACTCMYTWLVSN